MRVLDLGSGMGDVALLLAEIVGPEAKSSAPAHASYPWLAHTLMSVQPKLEALGIHPAIEIDHSFPQRIEDLSWPPEVK